MADAEGRVLKAQGRHDKEQRSRQQKALDAIEKRATQAAQQFVGPQFDRAPGVEDQHELSADTGTWQEYDVFLSHASEDKDDIARPLQEALAARDIVVWFDEINIKVGQSIRQEIERGIARARFGVVVISPDFFAKQWTQSELDALFGKKTTSGENLILPVWHRVTKDQVQAQSPLLSGILALNSSVMGVEEMADAIAEVVNG